MSEIAPAPWHIVSDGFYRQVRDAQGGWVAGVGAVNWNDGRGDYVEPTARLIAAAPDILEAAENARDLLQMMNYLECGNGAHDEGCTVESPCVGRMLETALAKARGES